MSLTASAPAQARPSFLPSWIPSLPAAMALAVQLAAVIWWTASINARVASLEQLHVELAGVPAQLARLDERSQQQSVQLQRLTSEMDARTVASR